MAFIVEFLYDILIPLLSSILGFPVRVFRNIFNGERRPPSNGGNDVGGEEDGGGEGSSDGEGDESIDGDSDRDDDGDGNRNDPRLGTLDLDQDEAVTADGNEGEDETTVSSSTMTKRRVSFIDAEDQAPPSPCEEASARRKGKRKV